MIKIYEGCQNPQLNHHFHQMFMQRAGIFKHELGWDIELDSYGYDKDQYDDENTIYMMDLDKRGNVIGSVRLRSTLAPHMMTGSFKTVFPELTIKSPTIFEGSRLATIDTVISANGLSMSMTRLLLGLCELGIQSGFGQLIAIIETPMLRLYKKCGLNPTIIGKATTDHCNIMVGLWNTNQTILRDMQAKLNYHQSVFEPDWDLEERKAA